MNPSDSMLETLFARGRAERPDISRAEYAFETRLLARLRESERPAPAWGLVSWRLIPAFLLVVAGLAVWQVQVDSASQEAAQTASLQNPEAVDMVASFN
jgi:hypothetical protein